MKFAMQRLFSLLQKREQTHILNEDCIHADAIKFVNELKRVVKFLVINNGIHRNEDLCSKLMCIPAQLRYVLHGITRSSTCTEALCSDVNGIRSMVNGCYAAFKVLGRG